MDKDKLDEKHYCDNVNCNHNNTKGLCCMFNPDNCKYRQLQKENAELDCQKNRNKFCYSCANATEKCFKNEIGCPCDKYKSYKDENAELKEKLGNVQMQKAGEKSDLVWKLKTANEQKADQLTKAKELEKEAEEFTDSKKSFWRQGRTCIDSVKQAYLAGAEPREKRIAELEAQIEKMKSDVISERDHSDEIEDIITCTVLNDILKNWE